MYPSGSLGEGLFSIARGRDWFRILQALMSARVCSWDEMESIVQQEQAAALIYPGHPQRAEQPLPLNWHHIHAGSTEILSVLFTHGGGGGGRTDLPALSWLHKNHHCYRGCSALDPSVLREQRAWKSAMSLGKVSSAGSNLSCSYQWSELMKILLHCMNSSGSGL